MAEFTAQSKELANATPKINSLSWPRSVLNGKLDGQSSSKIILSLYLPNLMPDHSSWGRGGKWVSDSDTDIFTSPSTLLIFMQSTAWPFTTVWCHSTQISKSGGNCKQRKLVLAPEERPSFIPLVYCLSNSLVHSPNRPPSMKKIEKFRYKKGLKGWKWSSLNAVDTSFLLSHPILKLDDFPFLHISPLG